jgi:hypothetical protein
MKERPTRRSFSASVLDHYSSPVSSGRRWQVGAALALGSAGASLFWTFSSHPAFLAASITAAALLVLFSLWKLPQWQVSHSEGVTRENRFDRENEARKTLAQIFGGVFLLAGLYSQSATLTTAREGQITDRFTKAIDQLGAVDGSGKPRLEIRLGGIYALERIARDSERDHWPVIEVLTAYVRQNSPSDGAKDNKDPKAPYHRLSPDIQAILSVLARGARGGEKIPIDLDSADLSNCNLSGMNLSGFSLSESKFAGCQMVDTKLTDAFLTGADLEHTFLVNVDLTNAHLLYADLEGVYFRGTDMKNADLEHARIQSADFSRSLNLTQKQINTAIGDNYTKLPAGLHAPPGWLK